MGFVIVSGVHAATIPILMTERNLTDPNGPAHDIAWNLIQAAWTHPRRPAFSNRN